MDVVFPGAEWDLCHSRPFSFDTLVLVLASTCSSSWDRGARPLLVLLAAVQAGQAALSCPQLPLWQDQSWGWQLPFPLFGFFLHLPLYHLYCYLYNAIPKKS